MNYPNLENVKRLAVDIETYDPLLKDHGPGVYRGDGHILGVSLSDSEGYKAYYNFGHEDGTKEEKDANKAFIRDALLLPCDKVFANGLYDMDWLQNSKKYGYKINGTLHDVQIAEPLLDENKFSFSLDSLATEYLGQGKTVSAIDKYCAERGWKGDARTHLYKMPYAVVKEYAEDDADVSIKVLNKQLVLLEQEGLTDLYRMEMGVLPLLLRMRKTGVRVDRAKLDANISWLQVKLDFAEKALFAKYGVFNYTSFPQTMKMFIKLGLDVPMDILKDKQSFSADALNYAVSSGQLSHPIGAEILACRAIKTSLGFMINAYHDNLVGDRIHGSFNPMRSDESGTVSGRFSGTHPNLQQVHAVEAKEPGKEGYNEQKFNDDYGVRAREIFVPEQNHSWGKLDYDQAEYRIISHYADGPRASEVRELYAKNPDTDYHAVIMEWTGLIRAEAKRVNFGMAYSMGWRTMAYKFGWSFEKAKSIIEQYNELVPFIRYTSRQVGSLSSMRDAATGAGYIKTILGRKARVSEFIRKYDKHYIMFNRLIQGSAADLMKKAMFDSWNKGLYDVLPPHFTIHDELDVSIPPTSEGTEAVKELKSTMEQAVKFKVPMTAELKIGTDWARTKEFTQ